MDFNVLQEERRRFPRVRAHIPVNYRLKMQNKIKATLSRDISEGGIRLWIEGYIPINANFLLEMNLPKIYKMIRLVARVAWVLRIPHSDRYQLGLEFIEINQAHKKDLTEYIKMLQLWPDLGLV
jgi:c-di-GMP-binding flagellar brake protein YcgR